MLQGLEQHEPAVDQFRKALAIRPTFAEAHIDIVPSLQSLNRHDEALVFKVYDSMKDGRARFTAHTAFDDPTTPPHARPRESIEIRTLAFF